MKTQYLDEPEAWRLVAQRMAGPRPLPGLCLTFDHLNDSGYITDEVWQKMEDRVQDHLAAQRVDTGIAGNGYAFDKGDHETRVLAALLLALEAEEEGR